MRSELRRLALTVACGWFVVAPALAEESEAERIAELEERVEELEDAEKDDPGASQGLAEWAKHVSLGGSARTGWYNGGRDSPFYKDNFQVWDARLFVDAELGGDLRMDDTTLLRNVGFTVEYEIVRLGNTTNDVGELYTDFQGIGESSWVNLQVGRFQLPVGESYLLYSKGVRDQAFITNPVGGPWFWDEGLRFYGSNRSGSFGYVASISDGETSFDVDWSNDSQYTLKLYANPTDWLHLSISGQYSGKIGSNPESGRGGSLWLGETWATAFGRVSGVANYDHGAIVADGPMRIERTHLVGADVILTFPEQVRVWLAYGSFSIHQSGGIYDRRLQYWVGELQLFGSLILPELEDVYLGFRAHGLGTYDSDEGYLLDIRYTGSLGYNMKSMNAWSTVVGWKLLPNLTIRAEYTHLDIALVRGVSAAIRNAADSVDSWGVEVGIHF